MAGVGVARVAVLNQMRSDEYCALAPTLDTAVVCEFGLMQGGIGDFFKIFAFSLELAVASRARILVRNTSPLAAFLHPKHAWMTDARGMRVVTTVNNAYWYNHASTETTHGLCSAALVLSDWFEMDASIVAEARRLAPPTSYVALHIRRGDKHLETNLTNVVCKHDERPFDASAVDAVCAREPVLLVVGDHAGTLRDLKARYPHVALTGLEIGHTSLHGTPASAVRAALVEFMILGNARSIVASSTSGFPHLASRWHGREWAVVSQVPTM